MSSKQRHELDAQSLALGLVMSQSRGYEQISEDRLTQLTPWYASATDCLTEETDGVFFTKLEEAS